MSALDFAMEPELPLRDMGPLSARKYEVCRRIFSASWPGEVGRQMVLRGEFDDEPEMLRLLAAFEEGARHG